MRYSHTIFLPNFTWVIIQKNFNFLIFSMFEKKKKCVVSNFYSNLKKNYKCVKKGILYAQTCVRIVRFLSAHMCADSLILYYNKIALLNLSINMDTKSSKSYYNARMFEIKVFDCI